jgi:hypothetical protein
MTQHILKPMIDHAFGFIVHYLYILFPKIPCDPILAHGRFWVHYVLFFFLNIPISSVVFNTWKKILKIMPLKKLLVELQINMLFLKRFGVLSKKCVRQTINCEVLRIKQLSLKLNTDFLMHCKNQAEINTPHMVR